MTERMQQLHHVEMVNKQIELNNRGWYCNEQNKLYKKNDIEFDNVHEAHEYEFGGDL